MSDPPAKKRRYLANFQSCGHHRQYKLGFRVSHGIVAIPVIM